MFGLCTGWCLITCLSWTLGIYTFLHTLIGIGYWVWANFIRKPHNLIERYGKDSWVVVTGPTTGIGEQYAIEFARKGFNIVLLGRNKEKLTKTENYVKDINKNIKVKVVEADLSESVEVAFYQNIYDQIKDLDISVLVNNAGVIINKHFERITPQENLGMLNVNCGAPIMLSFFLIKKLKDRKNRSAIINLSSIADTCPAPYSGVYSGTKRLVTWLSHGLHVLFREKIDVINVTPGYVTTRMARWKDNAEACTPKVVCDNSMKALGFDFEHRPYIVHSIMGNSAHVMYRFFKPMWKAVFVDLMQTMALKFYYEEQTQKNKAKKND